MRSIFRSWVHVICSDSTWSNFEVKAVHMYVGSFRTPGRRQKCTVLIPFQLVYSNVCNFTLVWSLYFTSCRSQAVKLWRFHLICVVAMLFFCAPGVENINGVGNSIHTCWQSTLLLRTEMHMGAAVKVTLLHALIHMRIIWDKHFRGFSQYNVALGPDYMANFSPGWTYLRS